nr:immunoglobulin light chain junction region [Macaca mulatta]
CQVYDSSTNLFF